MKLKVSEIFCSLQGEGLRVGEPAVFLRLAGCNLRCSYCDTKYSWESGDLLEIEEVVQRVKDFDIRTLIVTGGEPTLQSTALIDLVNKLVPLKYSIMCETNGSVCDEVAIDFLNRLDMVAVSPKLKSFMGEGAADYNMESVLALLSQLSTNFFLKFVVTCWSDLDDILSFLKYCSNQQIENFEVFLQPNASLFSDVEKYVSFLRSSWERTIEFQKRLLEENLSFKVRMVPQLHRLVFWEVEEGI
ncbi:radical SAM domain protein [Thermosulfidibacter takaii ABI70S6]|uniref:7-carboxy-7-deazaguanine synthase n=1 Tax=Thermosulfidibacter takaii (strain DSM 17441 / JCM 13301 / NBRC 103674 / ABI70S6) TaxID=1298851 RepID=A0A0S3QTI4_THET7|nr:7-carboxy-7-deazaguanine synthase QueE [Thermosulfidibacter takaii]BAT71612.1 radical SAM domain protein [Thermosulfidibacter takaii ABI70S6]